MSEEINETELEEKEVPAKTDEEKDEPHDVEHYCYLCRRPESAAGKMITLPKEIGRAHV